MPDHRQHEHFQCPNCATLFCTEQEQYAKMAEGDACPECHVATVVRMQEIPSPFGEGFPDQLKQMFRPISEAFDNQEAGRREWRLMEVASRLFAHLTPGNRETDEHKALRAVDIAFRMEAAMWERMDQQAQVQEEGE